MRTTSSVAFYCRESKVSKNGLAPVEASITLNGKRTFLSLPVKVKPAEFNARKRPKYIEKYLDEWRVKFVEIQTELMANGLPVTVENLKMLVRTGGVITCKLSDISKAFLGDLKHRAECAVYRKYELCFERLIRELGDVEINTVTNGQLSRHYELLKKDYKPATSASMFQKIRSLFKFAVAEGKIRTNPAEGIKVSKGKPEIDYLTEDELNRIAEYQFDNESLERVRDVYLFMCYSGLSYADMTKLEPGDVTECNGAYYIRKQRQKTGTEYVSVLIKKGYEIYTKYHGRMPVLSNQKTNAYLKCIADLAGIKKKIHCHQGRRNYGMILLNSGCRLETVAAALGHSNTQVTQQHYAKLVTSTVVEEISSIFQK